MNLYCIYILTNYHHTVLYVGFTSDLPRRLWEHQNAVVDGFTKKYRTTKLIYYEVAEDAYAALTREKQIKGWTRAKKEALIHEKNPFWTDLAGYIDESAAVFPEQRDELKRDLLARRAGTPPPPAQVLRAEALRMDSKSGAT